MQDLPNADAGPHPPAVSYAGLLQRAAAIMVDTTLLLVMAELIAAIGPGESIADAVTESLSGDAIRGGGSIATIIQIVLAAVYFIVLNGRGATLGKRVVSIRVIDDRGNAPGLQRAAIRYVIPFVVAVILQAPFSWAEATDIPGTESVTLSIGAGGLLALGASLISAFDDLSMLWHPRRQTLHDRMAGTYVVPVKQAALVPPGQKPARLRPVIVILSTFLLICVLGLMVAIPQADKWIAGAKDDVADVMASQLEASCIDTIRGNGEERGSVRLLDRDLTLNNMISPGEVGWQSGTEGTFVFGMDLHFIPDRIALDAGDGERYSGAPIVSGGQIQLVDIQVPEEETLLSDEAFERVVVDGLNGCLEFHFLDPAALSVDDDVMVVEVTAAP